jgi:excisionase family DNA binding protein
MKYVRIEQIAEILGVCQRTVRNWMVAKVVPYHKIGRVILFDVAKVEAALNKFERVAIA